METSNNPNEIAEKVLTIYLEGKSYEFVKEVCDKIISVFNTSKVTSDKIENFKTKSETLSELHQLLPDFLKF